VSVDGATAPTLATLRQARGQQEAIVRWLNRIAPALLVVFVVAAFVVHPTPGVTGRRLLISIAVAAFVVSVLGRNGTSIRLGRVHIAFVTVLFASSVVLMLVQPDGPGAEGVLLGVLCVARLLPPKVATPALLVAFLGLEVISWVTHRGDISVLAALGALYGMLYLAFRLVEANKQAERLVAELEKSQAAQARAAGLAERQRLAREMHDVLAHSLSGLMLQLEGARMLAADNPADPRLPAAINRAHHLGKSGLDEARRAIGMLRDDELPGPERLAALATQFQQDRGIPCRLTVCGAPYELGSEARLAVYRVAQEALTNVAKHGQPVRVELRLAYESATISLTIEDFGRAGRAVGEAGRTDRAVGEAGRAGRNPDGDAIRRSGAGVEMPAAAGYGLNGMRERAELLGGTLTTEPTATGFRVELSVPVSHRVDAPASGAAPDARPADARDLVR
jgi:signal transduction histidine kinase